MKSKIQEATIVTCDAEHCTAEFRSFSVPAVIDAQLEAAKWTLLEVRDPRAGEKQIRHLCPTHRPLPRMSGAQT